MSGGNREEHRLYFRIMNEEILHEEGLNMAEEKKGSGIGAAAAGGAAGTAAGVGGTVAGAAAGTTGAAAISSGLSVIGGIVGGGMFAGVCIVAAGPLIGGAIGYGIYKWVKRNK
jgi:hypothetical protein